MLAYSRTDSTAAPRVSSLNFNDKLGVKASRRSLGIASLVAEDSDGADVVVDVEMRVAVNPKMNPTLLDEVVQVRSEGRIQYAAAMNGRNGAVTWRMVGNDDGLGWVMLSKLALQPGHRCSIELCGFPRPKKAFL